MLLSKAHRKEYLKELGFESVLELQQKYFPKSEQDGLYGSKTDKLLRTAHNCKGTHFDVKEFKCGCANHYCTGYPDYVKKNLIDTLESIRHEFGDKPIQITSGCRCKKYNDLLQGSVKNSKHLQGKACDFYMQGATDSLANRKKCIRYAKTLKKFNYAYGNGITSKGASIKADYMGNALHIDVK